MTPLSPHKWFYRDISRQFHVWKGFWAQTHLILSVLIFHFLLSSLYLAPPLMPSIILPFLLDFCVTLLPASSPSVGVPRGSISFSSLCPAVTLTPCCLQCHTIRLAHVIVSAGAVAPCPGWQRAAERAEPDTQSDSTSYAPLINAAGWLVGCPEACRSNYSGVG